MNAIATNEASEASALLETARLAASAAGELVREKWSGPRTLRKKGYRNWVTDADFAAQALIASLIRERHPTHGFLAEEESPDLPSSGDVLWIIDPIDGTTNYSKRQPNFCISIAAVSGARVRAGVILDPLRNELFSAANGLPAQLNRRQIQVSNASNLVETVIAFDWTHVPALRQSTLDSLGKLSPEVHSLRCIGSAALALAWVAAGRLDAYWNWHLNAWDTAAGALIVEQAGGRCATIDGNDLPVTTGGGSCLISNGILHESLRNLVAAPGPPYNDFENR